MRTEFALRKLSHFSMFLPYSSLLTQYLMRDLYDAVLTREIVLLEQAVG